MSTEIIIPLDQPDLAGALAVVDALDGHADFFKVGHQLFTAEGATAVRELKDRGKRVFLDLKYHDIPNTVRGGVESAVGLGVDLTTVHSAGGPDMMAAAAEAAGNGLLVVAVTVLTSMSVTDIEAVWAREISSLREETVRLAQLAAEAGLGGVVCSAHEARAIKRAAGEDFKTVTPGIRFAEGDAHDQARVATPGFAAGEGADYLVVGRAIVGADDPAAAYVRAMDEIAEAQTDE